MENEIDAGHHIPQALDISHVPDIKFDLAGIFRVLGLQIMTHVVLLFFIAGEDADLANVGGEKMLQNRMSEAAGTAGDQQGLAMKNRISHKETSINARKAHFYFIGSFILP